MKANTSMERIDRIIGGTYIPLDKKTARVGQVVEGIVFQVLDRGYAGSPGGRPLPPMGASERYTLSLAKLEEDLAAQKETLASKTQTERELKVQQRLAELKKRFSQLQ